MKIAVLTRVEKLPDRTLGFLAVYNSLVDKKTFCTLELPWKDNARRISCIPAGKYRLAPRQTPDKGNHFIVENVKGRDFILIHSGNFPKHTQGCILIGLNHIDLDKDGLPDTSNSIHAMAKLVEMIKEPIDLIVI